MNTYNLLKKLEHDGLIYLNSPYRLHKVHKQELYLELIGYKVRYFKKLSSGYWAEITIEQFLSKLDNPKLRQEMLFNLNLFQ